MCLTKAQKNLLRECIEAILSKYCISVKAPPVVLDFFFLFDLYLLRDISRRMSEEIGARANRLCRQRWSSPSKAHRAFSKGERGGFLVRRRNGTHGTQPPARKAKTASEMPVREKEKERKEKEIMHAIMRINELWRYLWLYQARSTAPLPTPPVPELIFFHPDLLYTIIFTCVKSSESRTNNGYTELQMWKYEISKMYTI